MSSGQAIDLGWISLSSDEHFDDEMWVYEFFKYYQQTLKSEESQLSQYIRYTVQYPWRSSQIEDVFRSNLLLFDKIVLEASSIGLENDFCRTGRYIERDVQYGYSSIHFCYSFFTWESLFEIRQLLGDAIENREVLLLPTFDVLWDDPEEDEEAGYGTAGSDPDATGFFLNLVSTTDAKISRCQELHIDNAVISDLERSGFTTSFPIICGGKLKDLISLRRDEQESFSKWQKYADEVRVSQNKNPREFRQAVTEGLNELSDRLNTLKLKGILDVLQFAVVPASLAISVVVENQVIPLSAAMAAAATIPASLKTLVEQKKEKRDITQDEIYFLLVTRKLHDWDKD